MSLEGKRRGTETHNSKNEAGLGGDDRGAGALQGLKGISSMN